MEIRPACIADLYQIVDLVKAYAAEAGSWFFNVNEEACIEEAERDIPNTWVAENEGKLVGILILEMVKIKWSGDTILSDKLFYIKPEARKSTLAIKFMKLAKQASKVLHMPILMASFNGKDIERKDAFYKKFGYINLGGLYLLPKESGDVPSYQQ